MKFEAADPSEVSKAGSDGVDRSQGAARAISVSIHTATHRSSFLTQNCFISPSLILD